MKFMYIVWWLCKQYRLTSEAHTARHVLESLSGLATSNDVRACTDRSSLSKVSIVSWDLKKTRDAEDRTCRSTAVPFLQRTSTTCCDIWSILRRQAQYEAGNDLFMPRVREDADDQVKTVCAQKTRAESGYSLSAPLDTHSLKPQYVGCCENML